MDPIVIEVLIILEIIFFLFGYFFIASFTDSRYMKTILIILQCKQDPHDP
jgi:hypothetical protein